MDAGVWRVAPSLPQGEKNWGDEVSGSRFKVQAVFVMLTKEASEYVCLTSVLLTVSVMLSVVETSSHKTIIEMFRLLDPSTP